ncbi:MAG: ATPase domain-containing protein [Candidatus Aenigmatarchaeota archaeon]
MKKRAATKKAVSAKKGGLERIPTGIKGLDRYIEGGLIKGSTTLLTGATGTGKTIFCAQFIMEGLRRGEKCIFLTMEETVNDIFNDVNRFGWDLKKYADSGKLIIGYRDPFQLSELMDKLAEKIRREKIERVAIDSTSLFGLYYKDPFEVRKNLFNLLTKLKSTGATTILTSEMAEGDGTLSRFGVEEFVTDGVIVLRALGISGSQYDKSMLVRKMRRTNHSTDVHPFKITGQGIEVMPAEKGLSI